MKKLKGILYVALGASSYGVLATFVKVANEEGAHTSVLTFSQFTIGAIILTLIALFSKKSVIVKKAHKKSRYPKLQLVGFGTAIRLKIKT